MAIGMGRRHDPRRPVPVRASPIEISRQAPSRTTRMRTVNAVDGVNRPISMPSGEASAWRATTTRITRSGRPKISAERRAPTYS